VTTKHLTQNANALDYKFIIAIHIVHVILSTIIDVIGHKKNHDEIVQFNSL